VDQIERQPNALLSHGAGYNRPRCGESPEILQRLSRVFSPDALTIGFARRFATHKRANLILADIENLALMVNDPKRPVQFVDYTQKCYVPAAGGTSSEMNSHG
jgi:hypothetical protein